MSAGSWYDQAEQAAEFEGEPATRSCSDCGGVCAWSYALDCWVCDFCGIAFNQQDGGA